MKPNAPIFLYFLAYIVLFGTWAAVVFTENLHTTGADALVQYIQLTLASLTGHVLTMIDKPASKSQDSPVNAQAGRSDPTLLMILAGMMALAITGCASQLQAVSGAQASAVKSLKMGEDMNIEAMTLNMCATPFSAVLRHPEIIPAIKALCLPGGPASNPSGLLDAAVPSK
jgi:hypothetical protein